MEISFDHSFSGWWVLLALLLSLGISFLLYYRNSENSSLSTVQKGFLAFLRFASLFLIFLFLLSPLIRKVKKIKQLPILAVALDNSMSVKPQTAAFEELSTTIKERFSNDYQVEFWSFGEKVESNGPITGTERRSDYGQMIKTLKNNYINRNIGALIMVGDGIYNQGQNPVNFASGLKFPVYSIGVGDTTLKVDAAIRSVKTNKVAFLKNKFPIEIELKFSKLKNKIAYIEIENDRKIIYSSTVSVVSDDDFKLEFASPEATQTGLQHYKIRIRPFTEESNIKNNEYEFVIQVLENKQKILLLSDGPHPDLGALRNSLSELQNYESELVTGNDIPDSLKKYSLIVLNQLPSKKNAASTLLTRIRERRIPVLFLIGPNTLLEQLNTLDMGIKISASNNTEEVQAIFDDNFSLFVLSNETRDLLSMAPPLISPFGNTEISPLMQSLASQSIKNIRTSKSIMALMRPIFLYFFNHKFCITLQKQIIIKN